MTPEEKAKDIVFDLMMKDSIIDNNGSPENISISRKQAVRCAIITVDEILEDDWTASLNEEEPKRMEFWEEVKQEISKL